MAFFAQQARKVAWGNSPTQSPEPSIDGDSCYSQETKSSARLQRLSRSAGLEAFIEALEKDGCVVITDFVEPETIDKANAEVQPWLESQDNTAMKVGALTGQTRTVTRLIGRSKTVRERFFSDALYQDLTEHFLTLNTTHYYDNTPKTTSSAPLLSIAITFSVPPGTPAQSLHRDDKNHHARHAAATTYTANRDVLLGLFVAGSDTSVLNGATRVVPGSHLWDDSVPSITDDQIVSADLPKGSALLMLGSLYHGAGAYPTPPPSTEQAAETRNVHAMFCCTGVSRQEEVSFLSYPAEEVKTYSDLVRQRLGWVQSEPNLGWVDLKSPEVLLR